MTAKKQSGGLSEKMQWYYLKRKSCQKWPIFLIGQFELADF